MGLICEDVAWLVLITQFNFISVQIVISLLSTMPNIDNRNYLLVKVYFFHRAKPLDILFYFMIYIKKKKKNYP